MLSYVLQGLAQLFLIATSTWSEDWAWGLPLIVLTVVIHVLGLGLIFQNIPEDHATTASGANVTGLGYL
jgi:hypothetical protein